MSDVSPPKLPPLSARAKAQAVVALETLQATDAELQRDFAQKKIDWASDSFDLSAKDHVLLRRSTQAIAHHVQLQNPKGARAAALQTLSEVTAEAHLDSKEFRQTVLPSLMDELSKTHAMPSTAGLGKGVTLEGDALEAWNLLMGRMGQWEAKEFLTGLLQNHQRDEMLGTKSEFGSKHFMVLGDSGSGKSTFAAPFGTILHSLGYTQKDTLVSVTGSDFHGINSGEINNRVNEIFKRGKDGVIFIDEIQSLASQGTGGWSSSVYGAINAKLTDPEYKDTVVIFGGYPHAAEDLKACDSGLASRLPDSNIITLANLNVDEMTELFQKLTQQMNWDLPLESIDRAQKVLAQASRTPSLGNARFVQNLVNYCGTLMADRIARATQPVTGTLLPEDISLPPFTYFPCAFLGDTPATHEAVREFLSKRLVGQKAAIEAVARSIVAKHHLPANTEASRKPAFRLHFMGPSASGKSFLAREMAKTFMTPEDLKADRAPPIFELSANTVSSLKKYLAGAERGTVGSGTECPLLEWMKNTKGGVICINEVDKGPEDLMTTLMEIFDTGQYTPNSGRTFNFANYGVVLTSNYGNEVGLHRTLKGRTSSEALTPKKPGEVNGLAAQVADNVEVGGSSLSLVAVASEGTGRVEIKSNAQQTMVESAEIALKYLQVNASELGADPVLFKTHDFTIGISGAATKKDGPSAGITMATAMFSAATGKPVPPNIAMTGEITLTGTVEPVGGIREKVLGAFEQNIDTLILPEKNRADVEALPAALRQAMQFEFVKDLGGVLKAAFSEQKKKMMQEDLPLGVYQEIAELRAEAYMERKWPSEVRGRFDTERPVLFHVLAEDEIRQVVRKQVAREAQENLREAGLKLSISERLETQLLKHWNEETGARPVLQALMQEAIVPLLIAKETEGFPSGSSILADVSDGKVSFSLQTASVAEDSELDEWLSAPWTSHPFVTSSSDSKSTEKSQTQSKQKKIPNVQLCDSNLLPAALDKADGTNQLNAAIRYLNSGEYLSFENALAVLSACPRGNAVGWNKKDENWSFFTQRLLPALGLSLWGHAERDLCDIQVLFGVLDKVDKPLSAEQRQQLYSNGREILDASVAFQNKFSKYTGEHYIALDRVLDSKRGLVAGPIVKT